MLTNALAGRSAVLVALALSACNLSVSESPSTSDDSAPDALQVAAAPSFTEVVLSHSVLAACAGVNLSVEAMFESPAEGVSMRYRINGFSADRSSDWLEVVLQQDDAQTDAFHYSTVLQELGAQAEAILAGQGGSFEYQLVAKGSGQETVWPAGVEPLLSLPIESCESAVYTVHDYGPSSTQAGYGPTCTPHQVTFDIVIEGQVESATLQYQYYAPADEPQVIKTFEVQMPASDADPDYPNSGRFAVEVDIDSEASSYMEGESGFLGWNIYVKRTDQQVFEYPQGGPPMIEISACESGDLGVGPDPTNTPLGLSVVPAATPTQGLIIGTVVLYHSQGELLDLREGEYFDLDEGATSGFINNQVDFQLHQGGDVYLDDIKPVNLAYFGWHGEAAPSKADCEGTLKATIAQTIQWPDMQDTYWCYETNEGRQGWLKIQIWVSLPLNERRLEFSWGTFQ
jgi:hypothetical protein